MGRITSIPAFFGLRVAAALLLLKLSASSLTVAGFTVFSQLMLIAALLNLMAVGGVQNGLIRQAAAAADAQALAKTQTAALVIWAGVVPLLAIPILAASGPISQVLVGGPQQAWAVVAIALAALAAGPGQIWCSLLTGRRRTGGSLAAQALGLIAGAGGAAVLIVRGQPAAAAVAFACGGLVTLAVSLLLAARLRIPLTRPRAAMAEVHTLLRYSAALAATTGFTSITLFALRSLYRGAFGTAGLGYWLAANRISDLSTQLLGLFMIQVFVPQIATTKDEGARRALALRCWAAGSAGMATILAVFSLAERPLVHLFLSDAYLAAAPSIRLYMAGDVLRVWPSLAMYAAFAAGRPTRYAAIEIGALTLMAAITAALLAAGERMAPQIAYVAAYGTAAVVVTLAVLRRGPGLRFWAPPREARPPARQFGP